MEFTYTLTESPFKCDDTPLLPEAFGISQSYSTQPISIMKYDIMKDPAFLTFPIYALLKKALFQLKDMII